MTISFMKKRFIRQAFDKPQPIIAALGKAHGDSLTVYRDESGTEFLSNAKEFHSPINGKKLQAAKDPVIEVASIAKEIKLDELAVIAECASCDCQIVTTDALGEDLANTEIACPSCGETVEATYFGDLIEAAEDDDSDLDDVDDDSGGDDDDDDALPTDDDSDDEEDDESDDDEDEDDESDDETVTDEPTSEETANEDEADSDDDSADDSENKETPAQEAPASEAPKETPAQEAPAQEAPASEGDTEQATVTVMKDAELDKSARLDLVMSGVDMSRVDVFSDGVSGRNYLGSFLKSKAIETAKSAFVPELSFTNLTTHLLIREMASKEATIGQDLKDLGFVPAEMTIKIEAITAATELTEAEQQESIEHEVKERVDAEMARHMSAFELATLGVNKGVLEGPSLYTELASLLKRHNVIGAEATAQNFIKRHTEPFIKAALKNAVEIASSSSDYARGLTTAIEAASFGGSTASDAEFNPASLNSSTLPTTALRTPNQASKTKRSEVTLEEASLAASQQGNRGSGNRYQGLFSKMGRKR